ncbi:hypothetical protein BWR17_03960 [Phaeobacter inhibens]|uniref:hypothetical protein n=1 Tax=Phaeobacter inhibens TaxID=221822 RepID=UPI000971A600|nr:hypothetical protein [Phaeobacter inhibens]APX15085.1 hypothetical protein BWR17_03960 [Phaeobacter inhibens]
MTDHTNFNNIIASSPTLAQRWGEITVQVVKHAKEQFGVDLDADDVLRIREARIIALGSGELGDYDDELAALPAVREAQEKAAIASGDPVAQARAVAEIDRMSPRKVSPDPKNFADAREIERSHLNKLTRAREMGVTSVPNPTPVEEMTEEQKLAAIAEMPPATRIATARKWGLL